MPKNSVVLVSLILLLLIPFNSFSDLAFYHYGPENGLNEPVIEQIAQDSIGFIWLASDFGLTRYDGHQFKEYRNNQSQHHPWDKIFTIYVDKEGTLWIGSDTGISYYDFLKDEFISAVEWQATNINNIAEGLDGKLWLATYKGLGCFDKKTNSLIWYSGNESSSNPVKSNIQMTDVKNLCVQPDGKVWISVHPRGLYLMDPETGYTSEIKNPGGMEILEFDISQLCYKDDKLYISSFKNGFLRYDPNRNEIKQYNFGTLNYSPNYFRFSGDSAVWIGTNVGLIKLNRFNDNFKLYSTVPNDPLSIDRTPVTFLIIDNNNNLWCTSGTRGVNYGLNSIFGHFMFSETEPYNLSEKAVTSMAFDHNGEMWLGYESGLIERHNYSPLQKTRYLLSARENGETTGSVLSIFCDSKNRIWAGGWQSGLCRLNANGTGFEKAGINAVNHKNLNFSTADIRDIKEDVSGNLWIAMHGIGLIKYNPESKVLKAFKFNEANPAKSISNDYVLSIEIENDSILWVSSVYGLSRMNIQTERFTSFFNLPNDSLSLTSDYVNVVKKDAGGKIWAGTNYGLNLYDPETGKFYQIKPTDNSTSNIISSIVSVKPGEIWVATKKGIFQLTYQWKENEAPGFDINYYYTTNGLISSSYIDRSSAVSDNTIFFAGNEGIDYFHQEDVLMQKPHSPKTLITEITADGFNIVPSKNPNGNLSFQLNYDQHMVMFRFTSLDFTNNSQQKFRYKLGNFNKSWIYPQKEHVATYTNLKPGNYVFTVESTDKNGKWTGKTDSVSFHVIPPFWKTIPFLITVIVLSIIFIYSVLRIRYNAIQKNQKRLEVLVKERTQELVAKNRELEDANQTKTKFFSIISHDLRSPLSGLLGILELLKTPDMIEADKKDTFIDAAYNSANNTFKLLENLLIWSRSQTESIDYVPQSLNISKLISVNINLLAEMASQKNIEIKGEFPEYLGVFADRNMIDTVIRNLLNNAIKFTNPGGNITIHVKPQAQMVEIKIADNGIGLKVAQFEHLFTPRMNRNNGTSGESGTGLGLLICKEFVAANGGKIWVTSNHPQGSVFHFTVPGKSENI